MLDDLGRFLLSGTGACNSLSKGDRGGPSENIALALMTKSFVALFSSAPSYCSNNCLKSVLTVSHSPSLPQPAKTGDVAVVTAIAAEVSAVSCAATAEGASDDGILSQKIKR